MDGRVLSGSSAVNQAPITGVRVCLLNVSLMIPFLLAASTGMACWKLKWTHLAADNTISRIIQMVEEAQDKKAPAQRFVDKFARYYTPSRHGAGIGSLPSFPRCCLANHF